ncbi:hypothetical protein ACFX1Z_010131 [Malus domestica]
MQSDGFFTLSPTTQRLQSLSATDTRGKHMIHAELKRLEPRSSDRKQSTMVRHLAVEEDQSSSAMDAHNNSISSSPDSAHANSVFAHVVCAPEDPILGLSRKWVEIQGFEPRKVEDEEEGWGWSDVPDLENPENHTNSTLHPTTSQISGLSGTLWRKMRTLEPVIRRSQSSYRFYYLSSNSIEQREFERLGIDPPSKPRSFFTTAPVQMEENGGSPGRVRSLDDLVGIVNEVGSNGRVPLVASWSPTHTGDTGNGVEDCLCSFVSICKWIYSHCSPML